MDRIPYNIVANSQVDGYNTLPHVTFSLKNNNQYKRLHEYRYLPLDHIPVCGVLFSEPQDIGFLDWTKINQLR